jgi:hypothetical protein
MAQPVWVLSVDLQTKTATFTSGLADAAKSARGSFNDIKDGAKSAGKEVGVNMMEARHGVMLLGEEFGIHLPRALTTFISSLGPIGAAMEAAFPFLAIVVGATLLIEHFAKLKEEGEKLTESQMQFGAVTANVLNSLDEKLLQAGIRADELSGNHLDALEKQLQLIDHQSLKELEHSFDELAKSADATMALLKTHWYEFGAGSEGAKHALDEFTAKYHLLLAEGKDKEASDLLKGTLESAEKIQKLQATANGKKDAGDFQEAAYMKFEAARFQLKQQNIGIDEKAVQAQNTIVDALRAQVELQQKNNELKNLEKSNATGTTQKTIDADQDKIYREQAQAQQKAIEEQDRLDEENYNRAVSEIQQNEREKIAATEKGTAARLAAIDAAIKEENAKGLQETQYYKSLLVDRVNTAREMADQEKRVKQEADNEDIAHDFRMGQLQIEADREADQLKMSGRRVTAAQLIAMNLKYADEEYKLEQDKLNKEMAALEKGGKDYENKLRELQNRQMELTREFENKKTQITNQATEDRNKRLVDSERRRDEAISQSLTSVLMRQQTFAQMMGSLGNQIVSGMMQTAIQSMLAMDMTKEKDAAAAARKAFLAGWHFPFPANIVAAPALGAMAFAAAMAFNEGGMVPGVENFDSVNAKLTPGETVIPKQMTERLNRAAEGGDSKPHVHVHVSHNPVIQALDSQGMDRVLEKHADKLSRHVEHTLRKMNR